MLENNKLHLLNMINLLVDGGYTGDKFVSKVDEIVGSSVEVAKRNELHTFEVMYALHNLFFMRNSLYYAYFSPVRGRKTT